VPGKDDLSGFHRINGERRPKSFSTMAAAKSDAKNVLREVYLKGAKNVHLTDDEKMDYKSAMAVLEQAGIRSNLEVVCRHYADLMVTAGGETLLTDIVRKCVANRPKEQAPITIGRLQDSYVALMKGQGRSKRYVQALKSYCGIFAREVGANTTADKITRETIQRFLNGRKVGARGKRNFAESIRTLFEFAKSHRHVPEDWAEINHITLPLIKHGTIELLI
jgi:hypothetical protein